jgi:hypothetical protein
MKNQFELVGGSVIGREHRRVGKNNQDAFGWTVSEDGIVAVVCDGCGSGVHSEVGAKLGARLIVDRVHQVFSQSLSSSATFFHDDGHDGIVVDDPVIWKRIQNALLHELQHVADLLGGDRPLAVTDYLLFTITGIVITPLTTALFALGDGVMVVNGDVIHLGPFPNNAPPYLGYGVLHESGADACPIKVLRILFTEDVQTILLGSDGVSDLIQRAEDTLPGCSETVGGLSQFWQGDRYFRNPDQVRRRLTRINRDVTCLDERSHQCVRHPGLLPDDTTLIVIRRKEQPS